MKWFHHDCAALHDAKILALGDIHGAEGLGIYWGLLSLIGLHSDTFHLKVSGISTEADMNFKNYLKESERSARNLPKKKDDPSKIPSLRVRVLSRSLFTSPGKVKAVIGTCIEAGLFDRSHWLRFGILYSAGFARRGDEYARHRERASKGGRKVPGETPGTIARTDEPSATEQDRESEEEREENVVVSHNADGTSGLSALDPIRDPLSALGEDDIQRFRAQIGEDVRQWNSTHSSTFDWLPSHAQVRKLLCGGDPNHKLRLCYEAINVLGEDISYPHIVRRAFLLMLQASERKRIANPFGWLWSCLHGTGNGTAPWVHLVSAAEEE